MILFRYLIFAASTILASPLFCREIAYLDGSKKDQFTFADGAEYKDLKVWQKIHYILEKYGVKILPQEGVHLNSKSRHELREKYNQERQLFFVDYRGDYPNPQDMKKVSKKAMMNILFEPPSVFSTSYSSEVHDLFSKIFTFDDRLVDGKKFIKFRYFELAPMEKGLPLFEERKLCCGFFGNKFSNYPGELYSERKKIIHFFEKFHPDQFDFYGPWWDNLGYSTYKGVVEDKWDRMKHYKFAIAYENTKDVPGYITEKIFDCFKVGVVPVYLGSPTVQDEIPSDCFIDRRQFSSDEHLYQYLISITEDRFNNYLENIRRFLDSDEAKLFDEDHFVLSIVNGILNTHLDQEDLH